MINLGRPTNQSEQAYFHSERKNFEGGEISSSPSFFYDCPVLSGVLIHKFCHIWWDISSVQSIQGVCNNLLKVTKSDDMVPPYKLVLASRNMTYTGLSEVSEEVPLDVNLGNGVTRWQMLISCGGNKRTHDFYRKISNIQYLGIFMTFSRKDGLYTNTHILSREDTSEDNIVNDEAVGVKFSAAYKRRRSSIAYSSQDQKLKTISAAAELESATSKLLNSMIDEALHILPHLLSMKCPSDSVILNQPVVTIEPDKSAEIACRLLIQMLEDGGKMLLKRRDECIAAEALHKHSLFVLDSFVSITDHLKKSVGEMHTVMRKLSTSLVQIIEEKDSWKQKYTKTVHYEQFLMCLEEIDSIEANIKYLSHMSDLTVNGARASLLSINIRDWNLFGKLTEDPKSFVAYGINSDIIPIMKGIILLTDPKIRVKSNNEIAELKKALEVKSNTETLPKKMKLNEIRDSVILKALPVPSSSENGSPSKRRNPTRFTSLHKESIPSTILSYAVLQMAPEDVSIAVIRSDFCPYS